MTSLYISRTHIVRVAKSPFDSPAAATLQNRALRMHEIRAFIMLRGQQSLPLQSPSRAHYYESRGIIAHIHTMEHAAALGGYARRNKPQWHSSPALYLTLSKIQLTIHIHAVRYTPYTIHHTLRHTVDCTAHYTTRTHHAMSNALDTILHYTALHHTIQYIIHYPIHCKALYYTLYTLGNTLHYTIPYTILIHSLHPHTTAQCVTRVTRRCVSRTVGACVSVSSPRPPCDSPERVPCVPRVPLARIPSGAPPRPGPRSGVAAGLSALQGRCACARVCV